MTFRARRLLIVYLKLSKRSRESCDPAELVPDEAEP